MCDVFSVHCPHIVFIVSVVCANKFVRVCIHVCTSRFSGLISLCTMLMRCRYLRAPVRLYTMALASLSVYFVEEVMASNKSPPCEMHKNTPNHAVRKEFKSLVHLRCIFFQKN